MRDLDIRISPFQFIQLLKCDLYCSVNQHAKAYVEAIISADDEDAYVEMALERNCGGNILVRMTRERT